MVACYIRLSNEDIKNNKNQYSESINNQINYISEFARLNNITIDRNYIDDGFSGVNYNRPAFTELKNDIEKGKIKTLITKDISRLGREFIDTVYYITNYFKEYNIRYIAINDNYDSFNTTTFINDIMIKIKSIANELYIKETSKKISIVKANKTDSGNYIGFIAPYGYIKYKKDNRVTLKIDNNVKNIIIRIYEEIASGYSRHEVAKRLNNDNIISPIEYLKVNKSKNKDYSLKWTDIIIYKIIRNKTYLGHTIIRSSIKNNYKQQKREYIPISERDIKENTHEAIITNDLFLKANNMIKFQKNSKNTYEGIFKNIIICGVCRNIMKCIKVKRTDRNNSIYYHYKCLKNKCNSRSISEAVLKNVVLSYIKNITKKNINNLIIINNILNRFTLMNRLDIKIKDITKEIKNYDLIIKRLYLKKASGEIDLKQFVNNKETEDEMIKLKKNVLVNLKKKKNDISNLDYLLKIYNQFTKEKNISNYILESLITNIIIYKENKIIIKFNFNRTTNNKECLFKDSQQMEIKTT